MSTRIHRYEIGIEDCPAVEMPKGATVLSVHAKRSYSETLSVWALVDPTADLERHVFWVIGTGNPVPEDIGAFIGTALTHGGAAVWHVFDGGPA